MSRANAAAAIAYLARAPYDNVYVQWLIETGQVDRFGSAMLWRDRSNAVGGVCYYGAQIVPSASDDEALAAFGAGGPHSSRTSMIVGSRRAVEGFWEHARAAFPTPRAVRSSQPVYAIERAMLRGDRTDATVGRATRVELDEIAENSAVMIAGEIGGDPRATNPDFRGRTARVIDAGWWWRYRVGGKLAFMCNVGSASTATAQLQGVWSPPDMRGRGFGSRGLAAICDHLLDEYPTLCLYVNDFNAPAIALYDRVGFERAGEFSTILL